MSTNGSILDRSFTPDLLPEQEDAGGEFRYRYPCGPGQLTGIGFRHAVGLGKHLADAYGEHFRGRWGEWNCQQQQMCLFQIHLFCSYFTSGSGPILQEAEGSLRM